MSSILKVSEIQDPTNGNTALSIDSNGVIVRSVVPAWRATAIHDDRTSGTTAPVTWSTATDTNDNRRYRLGGVTLGGSSPDNHEFTVPVTGLYQLNVNMRLDEIGTGYVIVYLRVNDSTVSDAYSIEGQPSSSYQTMTICEVYYMEANDQVSVWVGTSADSSFEIDANSTFSGVLVG